MSMKNKHEFFLPMENLNAGYSVAFLGNEFFERYLDKKEIRDVILLKAKESMANKHLNKFKLLIMDYINENLKPQLDQYLDTIIELLDGDTSSMEDREQARKYMAEAMSDKLVPWFRMIN